MKIILDERLEKKSQPVNAIAAFSMLNKEIVSDGRLSLYLDELPTIMTHVCADGLGCMNSQCHLVHNFLGSGRVGRVTIIKTLTSPNKQYYLDPILHTFLNKTGHNPHNESLLVKCVCGNYVLGQLALDISNLTRGMSCPACLKNWESPICSLCGKELNEGEIFTEAIYERDQELYLLHQSCVLNTFKMKDCIAVKECGNTRGSRTRDTLFVCLWHRKKSIHSHDFRPDWSPVGKAPYFGIEIEVMPANGVGSTAFYRGHYGALVNWTSDNLLFSKHDGSVQEGFEIISQPISWNTWMTENPASNKIRELFAKISSKFTSYGDPACGMHVHIDTKAFTNANHISRFAKFIMYQEMLSALVAERTTRTYSQFNKSIADQTIARLNGDISADRYYAVNVQRGAPTVEVRMFKGNLKWDRIIKNIQYCQAAVEFSFKINDDEIKKPSAANEFIKMVNTSDDYPILKEFINSQPKLIRNLI